MRFPEYANKNDRTVVTAIIRNAIKRGWNISVNDGEEWVVRRSNNENEISAAMFSTDEDYLKVYADGQLIGSVYLVWGNDGECLADYSCGKHEAFDGMMQEVSRIAERF